MVARKRSWWHSSERVKYLILHGSHRTGDPPKKSQRLDSHARYSGSSVE